MIEVRMMPVVSLLTISVITYIIKNYFTNKLLWSYLINNMLYSSSFGYQKESSCLLECVLVEPNPDKMTKNKQYIFAEAK